MPLRPYERRTDTTGLWRLKHAFETELGTETGTTDKQHAYEAKLTDEYRKSYLEWVDRCTASNPWCVTVVEEDTVLVGYAFVLPAHLAMIWDAAVLNEIYVTEPVRGTGIADDLLEKVFEIARSQPLPMDRLVLDVDPDNHRAWAFYQRHGFQPWGRMVACPLTE